MLPMIPRYNYESEKMEDSTEFSNLIHYIDIQNKSNQNWNFRTDLNV